jgi:hypothetical protein
MAVAEDTEFMNKERQRWIKSMTKMEGSGIKYVRQLSRTEIEEMVPYGSDGLRFMDSRVTGKEFLIEYHLFSKDGDLPIIAQWRNTECGEVRSKRDTKPTSRADRRCKVKAEAMATKLNT